MNKLNLLAVAGIAALLPLSAQAAFPGNFANADTYNISISKVELCRTSACSNPYVIGSGSKTFDISSSTAGADVGGFVNVEGIPLYQTWSHVRVTLGTTITISAAGTDNNGVACSTNSANGASSHTALGVPSAGGTGTLQTFVVPNAGGVAGGPIASEYTTFNMTKVDNSSSMTVLYPLTSPYICTGVMPKIAVEFNTQNTMKFLDAGGGACTLAYPMPPTVTITVSDP